MNTTSAPIGARREVTTNPLWQYDYGQKLIIKGVSLPTSYEVLFGTTGDLIPVLGDENGCNIPDILLQEGTDITAYLFLHTGEDDGEVEYVINIPVKQRPKTSEEPLTPVEQNIIEQAIAVLNLATDKTNEYMQTAKGYRDEAEVFKNQASTSEYNASVSEENAHSSEVNALSYARRAETAESNVSVIETRVEGYIETATELNDRLDGFEQEIADAKDEITSEGTRQVGLVSSEGTSQVSAVRTEGQTQVEAVQTEGTTQVNAVRTEGGTQITDIEQRGADVLSRIPYFAPIITDTASGSIASFTDGADDYPMQSVVAEINPIQDLHGQSSPYPAGGGKNKFPNTLPSDAIAGNFGSSGVITSAVNARVFAIPCKQNTDYTFSQAVTGAAWFLAWGTKPPEIGDNVTYIRTMTSLTSVTSNSGNNTYLIVGVSSVNEYNTAVTNKAQIEEGSTATAYAPYSNICPIEGWSGVEAVRTGINLWDEEWRNGYYDNNGVFVPNSAYVANKNPIKVKPLMTIYGVEGAVYIDEFKCYDENMIFLGNATRNSDNSRTTLPNTAYINFRTRQNYGGTYYKNDISLNYPSTDTSYHPYQGESKSIPFKDSNGDPITVYGGEIDVVKGEGEAVLGIVHAKDLSWNAQNNLMDTGTYYMASSPVPFKPWSSGGKESAMSNALIPGTGANTSSPSNSFWWSDARTGYRAVWGQPQAGSTTQEFKEFLEQNDVVFIGELVEPTPIYCEPTEIKSLKGSNNVWADTGDVEVEYCADTKLYIDRKIGEL